MQFNLTNIRLINLKTCKRNDKTFTLKKIINKLYWTKIHNSDIKYHINCKRVCTHVTPTHKHTPILIVLNQIHSSINWTHTHYPNLIRHPPHIQTIQPRYSIHTSSAGTEG